VTASEACTLLVDQAWQLCNARRQCAVWRLIALTAIHQASELQRENEMIDRRCYIHQQRTVQQRPDAMTRRQEDAA